jgi:hypothetical protein
MSNVAESQVVLGAGGGIATRARPVNPALRELGETWYQRDRPFVIDASKFQRTFGPLVPTPHRQAVAATLDWFREHPR